WRPAPFARPRELTRHAALSPWLRCTASLVAMLTSMVDEKRKAELEQQLSTLRAELDELARTDADGAKTVAGFAELSAHEATRARPNPELLGLSLAGLRRSAKEFEQTHPRLVEIVGSLSAILSNVGL